MRHWLSCDCHLIVASLLVEAQRIEGEEIDRETQGGGNREIERDRERKRESCLSKSASISLESRSDGEIGVGDSLWKSMKYLLETLPPLAGVITSLLLSGLNRSSRAPIRQAGQPRETWNRCSSAFDTRVVFRSVAHAPTNIANSHHCRKQIFLCCSFCNIPNCNWTFQRYFNVWRPSYGLLRFGRSSESELLTRTILRRSYWTNFSWDRNYKF